MSDDRAAPLLARRSSSPRTPSSPATPDALVLEIDTNYELPTDSESALPQCRICLEDDTDDQLIVPCLCRGSARFVHRACLDDWRAANVHHDAFDTCTTCRFRYVVEGYEDEESSEEISHSDDHCCDNDIDANTSSKPQYFTSETKAKLRVVRDILLGILAVFAALVGVGFLLYFIDDATDTPMANALGGSMPLPAVYSIATVIVTLTLLGFMGILIKLIGLESSLLGPQLASHEHHIGHACGHLCCWQMNLPHASVGGDAVAVGHEGADGWCCGCAGDHGCSHCCCHECGGGDSGDVMVCFVVIAVVFFSILGLFYGVYYACRLLDILSAYHIRRRWFKECALKRPVKDWQHGVSALEQLALARNQHTIETQLPSSLQQHLPEATAPHSEAILV